MVANHQRFTRRIDAALAWRQSAIRDFIYHLLGSLGSCLFVNIRWPWPVPKPYQRKHLILKATGDRVGDALMCTAVIREIKNRNPHCQVSFITHHPDLFSGNSNIDKLISNPTVSEMARAVRIGYEHMTPLFTGTRAEATDPSRMAGDRYAGYNRRTPPPRPLIVHMAECVGLRCFSNQLDCAVPQVSDQLQNEIEAMPGPLIVIQTRTSNWTTNKDWPAEYWRELVSRLTERYQVLEVGTTSALPSDFLSSKFRSYVGRTTLNEYVYIVRSGDLFVGPDSASMHIANAFRVPSVIIFGGFTSPDHFQYPRLTALYSPIECAPCWLETACPFALKCMHLIRPERVLESIEAMLLKNFPKT